MTIRTCVALLCGAAFLLTTQIGALAAEDKTKKKAGNYHLIAHCEDREPGKAVKNKKSNCNQPKFTTPGAPSATGSTP